MNSAIRQFGHIPDAVSEKATAHFGIPASEANDVARFILEALRHQIDLGTAEMAYGDSFEDWGQPRSPHSLVHFAVSFGSYINDNERRKSAVFVANDSVHALVECDIIVTSYGSTKPLDVEKMRQERAEFIQKAEELRIERSKKALEASRRKKQRENQESPSEDQVNADREAEESYHES